VRKDWTKGTESEWKGVEIILSPDIQVCMPKAGPIKRMIDIALSNNGSIFNYL
jgi:hypothetical protein